MLSDSNALVVDPTVQGYTIDFALHIYIYHDVHKFKGDHTFGILCENGKYRFSFSNVAPLAKLKWPSGYAVAQ